MEPIERLYKKEKTVTRSLHIDEDLYEKLQILCETSLQNKDKIKFYKKPYKCDSIYRSILFRKEYYDKLIEIRDERGISFSRLVNGSIKDFLDKYNGKYFNV